MLFSILNTPLWNATSDKKHMSLTYEEAYRLIVTTSSIPSIWNAILQMLATMPPREDLIKDCGFEWTRYRFHLLRDPLFFREGKLGVEVYYRYGDDVGQVVLPVTEDDEDPNPLEFYPWDTYCGYMCLHVQNGSDVIRVTETDEDSGLVLTGRYSITDAGQFADTWTLAKERCGFFMPGTNVPYEEATEAIYNELKLNLPRKQYF